MTIGNSIKTKQYTFGTCAYEKTSPLRKTLSANTKALNVLISFEEALKLNIAIDECVRKLNSYKRSTVAGKKAALKLTIHLELERITINEGKI